MSSYIEFSDSRLVRLFGAANSIDWMRGFYPDLASRLGASRIVDLGCGTGLLTLEFARHADTVVGVEPASALLDIARARADSRVLEWVEWYADSIGEREADLVVMTGHVAQFFLTDDEWRDTLGHIHGALRPGGYLAFESRSPAVQPYLHGGAEVMVGWPSASAPGRIGDSATGVVEWWPELAGVLGSRVRYDLHYRFTDTGEELVSANELIFRTRDEIASSLAEAGFDIVDVFGDWDRSPFDEATSPEMIFVARRTY